LAYRQTLLFEFTEPSTQEGSSIPEELDSRLDDIEMRIGRLEGQRVFTSGEPPRAIDHYVDEHPEMVSVNEEVRQLISSGRIKVSI